MSKEQKSFNYKIKYYHILLLSILLSAFLIENSNYEVKKRTDKKIRNDLDKKIKRFFMGRNLNEFEEGMKKICNRTSNELQNYYSTGLLNKVGINRDTFEKNVNGDNPEHIEALIDIVKEATNYEHKHEMKENVKIYGKHIIYVLGFFCIAILAIPGWIICCSCSGCSCCCCCCCKKTCCKCPFFAIVMVFYIVIIIVCIFGLLQSNSIFEGLSDMECSILKFCNEVIEGESKENKPKWIGITNIGHLLDELGRKVGSISSSLVTELNEKETQIKEKKEDFEDLLEDYSKKIIQDNNAITFMPGKNYRLDITTKNWYGEFDKVNQKVEPETSMINAWYNEYSEIAKNSENFVEDSKDNFDKIMTNNDNINNNLAQVNSQVDKISVSINEVKDSVTDIILKNSDDIDYYGKFGIKIMFSFLMIVDAALALIMVLFCLCTGKSCSKCCCCRCIFKILIHVLWNILALLMILTLFLGAIFTFIGSIGKDMVIVINYFISDENLKKEKPALFGLEGSKLETCINGDGDILNDLGINKANGMDSFDSLIGIKNKIVNSQEEFKALKNERRTYNLMMNALDERVNYQTDFYVSLDSETSSETYTFYDYIDRLNKDPYVIAKQHIWDLSCNDGTIKNDKTCFNPKTQDTSQIYGIDESSAHEIGEIIQKMKSLVNLANEEDNSHPNNFKKLTDGLNGKYNEFLQEEVDILQIFVDKIQDLTRNIIESVGENGNTFDFVNCKFIGNNIQVILQNFKDSLGNNIYTLGMLLIIAGLSMAISIPFTILFVIIINNAQN